MELTPQSTRLPKSKSGYTSNPHQLYEYPSPAQSDSRYRLTDSLRGLGLYSGPMSRSMVGDSDSLTPAQSLSSATNNWPTTSASLQPHHTPRSSHSAPNILSAEYDPFAPYHPADSAPYSHDIYSALGAEVNILPASPIPSSNTSHRSSFSSAPTSEIFTQAGSIHSYTPRIKMEDHSDYGMGSETTMVTSPQLNHSLLVTSASSYAGSLEAAFYQDQSPLAWSKVEYTSSQDLPSISSLPIRPSDKRSEIQDRSSAVSHSQRRSPSAITRTRQPRKLTTKEDANFQCTVHGCGKFFGRSYNFKAHMETHDAGREYPFPCPLQDCSKKFVRKTDLQRHHQSVHMKQRNHRCDYCGRNFARRDTLRRHMEDGCSKRFDIETVDFRPQNYSNGDPSALRFHPGSADNQSRKASGSSSGHYSPAPGRSTSQCPLDSPLTSSSRSYFERHDYMSGDSNQDSVWSS